MTTAISGSRPIKRRRTRAAMARLREAVYETLEQGQPMTVRQVFYQLVSQGAIAKTESEYKRTVIRLLVEMRRNGEIPYGWVADNTRWMRRAKTYSGVADALRQTARFYRRAIWDRQDAYVEIWLEKDALAGVLLDATTEWDVPLMVTRGYPSLSYLYEAAEAIEEVGKPTYLYYFGDYDPSGLDIPRVVERDIREFAPSAEIYFERVAVTPRQIDSYGLLTRPTKPSDTRSRRFQGESVELDAFRTEDLRELVRDCIVRHIDEYQLSSTYAAENSERDLLKRFAEGV